MGGKVSIYNKNNNTKQREAEKFRSCTVKLSVKLLGVKFTRRLVAEGKSGSLQQIRSSSRSSSRSSYRVLHSVPGTKPPQVLPRRLGSSEGSAPAGGSSGLLRTATRGSGQWTVRFLRNSSRLLPSLVSDSTPCATKVKEPDNGASPRPPCCHFGRLN